MLGMANKKAAALLHGSGPSAHCLAWHGLQLAGYMAVGNTCQLRATAQL